jgi:hypothetical protein
MVAASFEAVDHAQAPLIIEVPGKTLDADVGLEYHNKNSHESARMFRAIRGCPYSDTLRGLFKI